MRWRREIEHACADVSKGCHSVLELKYLRDVERAHGLPTADRQTKVGGTEQRSYDDVRYRAFEVAVELDGRRYHPDRRGDEIRDNARTAAGLSVLRYDWIAVTSRPCSVAREVADALTARGWSGTARRCGSSCTL
jgi:very-short-patch-repair endonuclease